MSEYISVDIQTITYKYEASITQPLPQVQGFKALAWGPLRRISAVIVTHRDVSVEDIGVLGQVKQLVYDELYPLVDGIVVLHTCNRFEVYIDAAPKSTEEAAAKLSAILEATPAAGKWKLLRGVDAIRHLYRVACGLESVMLGENEVLGQVREAWLWAKRNSYTSRLLDMVFHGAIVAGRRARRETGISRGPVGYPEAAITLASRVLGGLRGKRVLVVGAGSAGKSFVESLCSRHGVGEVVVANRTPEKALELASHASKQCPGTVFRARGLEPIQELFDAAFIAVSGAPRLDWVAEAARIVVDISTPPVVERVPGKVFVIEDVSRVVDESLSERRREVPRVEEIIEEEIERLERLVLEKRAEQAISLIMRTAMDIAVREAWEARTAIKNRGFDGVLDRAFKSYAKKILHPLLVSLRELAVKGHHDAISIIESNYRGLSQRSRATDSS